MDLVNKQVRHKSFGNGRVIKYNDSYIEIQFSLGNKTFIFPDAFKKYLMLNDEKASNMIEKIIEKKEQKLREEAELNKKKAMQRQKQRRILKNKKIVTNRKKIHPSIQVVYWCKEQDWESIFTDWRVSTGVIKSGAKKGQPNRLPRMTQNSACLLTAREPTNMREKDRYIKGVFMVNENFSGKLCEDGYIPAHSKYRLRLSEQESKKMLFWNYYINKRYPNKMTWNTGRYRYFDNVMMAQILRDIISLKKDPKDKEFVKKFFEHFCLVNQIEKEKLSKPNGALIRD